MCFKTARGSNASSAVKIRERIPLSASGWQRSSYASLPVTASKCKVVSLSVGCSAFEDFYGRKVVPFLREASQFVSEVATAENARAPLP